MSAETRPAAKVAAEIAPAVSAVGAGFMNDRILAETGVTLGYEGIDFYLAGRAGVLGDVSAEVAAAALVFFDVDTVRRSWARSAAVQPRAEAATAFAGCAAAWAAERMPDDARWSRLAELADRLCASAAIANAPLFAGWRRLTAPTAPPVAAVHHLNGLREHRMACHASAVIANGLDVADAVRLRQPEMLGLFGWEPDPDPEDQVRRDDIAGRWQAAEDQTNEAIGALYATLGDDELAEFTTLVLDAHGGSRRHRPTQDQPSAQQEDQP